MLAFRYAIVAAMLTMLPMLPGAMHVAETSQTEVKWKTLDGAMDEARRTGKKIMLDVYTDWCGWCKIMHARTYSDPEVAAYINEHFAPARLNAWEKATLWFRGYQFPYLAELKVNQLAYQLLEGDMQYPTTVFLSKHGEVLSPVQGYIDKRKMMRILRYFAEDHYQSQSWKDFKRSHRN